MQHGFIKVAVATPNIKVADCAYNTLQIKELINKAVKAQVRLLVLPELCLTGYTCGDLFHSVTLLKAAQTAVEDLLNFSVGLDLVFVLGLPMALGAKIYNAAAVINQGKLLGLVPKQHLANYSPYEEARFFSVADPRKADLQIVNFAGQAVPFGVDLLFACQEMTEFIFAVEIGEDLAMPFAPSSRYTQAGATLIANPAAQAQMIGQAERRNLLAKSQSTKLQCAYLIAEAGAGESTTDLIFGGENLIVSCGRPIAVTEDLHHRDFFTSQHILSCEIDLQAIIARRQKQLWQKTPPTDTNEQLGDLRHINYSLLARKTKLTLPYSIYPFVPTDKVELQKRCRQIFTLQSIGLAKRLRHTGIKKVVLGLSGGLDSTLALLGSVQAFELLQEDLQNIICVTMPGFGTTRQTYDNTMRLAHKLGVSLREISIEEAVLQHFSDIGHDPALQDITYENAQARERTQILMDVANQVNGMVIGTGDLSELALGWATYNGDHMSMYALNASVPKTLIPHLISYYADQEKTELKAVLDDILATPVSPELLPPKDGKIAQETESLVGPYVLHDFFLYYWLRFGFGPAKIKRLAKHAFGLAKPELVPQIDHWLTVFFQRFFAQQFKRSCLPDGPQIGRIALSPRGAWKMPSDACASLWLAELETRD